jgi:hypothetical protein
MNFQAALTSICAAHLLRGTPVGWLAGVVDDTPTAIWAETNGPGDDIRLETGDGLVEVQAKKGLSRGKHLWDSLLALAQAVHSGVISYGVLAVAPDSSGTIRDDLSRDLQRLGEGRDDDLTEIGRELLKQLKAATLPVQSTCSRLRVQVVHALETDRADAQGALSILRQVCAVEGDAPRAWDALYRAAMALIARKGRWELPDLTRTLAVAGVEIRAADFPAALLARLTAWVGSSNRDFSLPGLPKRIALSELLPMRTVAARATVEPGETIDVALERYYASGSAATQIDDRVFDAEWTGRFERHSVVVAGPGLGKSTLITQLAQYYAEDGYPVLRATLKSVAASMRSGTAFEESIVQWGLDGSGISSQQFREARLEPLVVLADGLDDCGDQHHEIAAALARFAGGRPKARIVVTTRPVGYLSDQLADWRHYVMRAPEKDSGAGHLAAMIRVATDDPVLQGDALAVATCELGGTTAAPAIVSSPQMLAMAASLIVRHRHLPSSRGALYQRLVATMATSPRAASRVSEAVAECVLDVIGWTLVSDPLASRVKVVAACATRLEVGLGLPRLAAKEKAEVIINAWENAGLVERLHHRDGVLTTFIHKSFAEFAAARHLVSQPKEVQRRELGRIIDDQAWAEVVSFAGGLGAGDEIAALFVDRQTRGTQGQLVRALALLGDADAQVSANYSRSLIEAAFGVVSGDDEEGVAVGLALAKLAETNPDLVGPQASARLDSAELPVRLTAWAAAIAAGPSWHDPAQIVGVLAELTPHVGGAARTSLLGGLRIIRQNRDLLQKIGLAALEQTPDEEIDDFLDRAFDGEAFDYFGFHSKLEAALVARGKKRLRQPSWMQRTSSNLVSLVNGVGDLSAASRAVVDSMARAVTRESAPEPSPCAGRRLLHFGALVRFTGVMEAVAGDLYAWTEPFDQAPVTETLRLLIVACGLDSLAIAGEAAEVIRRLDADLNLNVFRMKLPSADVPEPIWKSVVAARPDYDLIRQALAHGSIWLVNLATNLLEGAQADEATLRILLGESEGYGLAAAAYLVAAQLPERAQDLLLQHLSNGIRSDSIYVIRVLRGLSLIWNAVLADAVRSILLSSHVEVAAAAAELVEKLVADGVMTNPELVELAFEHWQKHEQPMPTAGIVPISPRPSLLRSLFALKIFDAERVMRLLQDSRGDVSRLAQELLIPRLAQSDNFRGQITAAIAARRIAPTIAARLLAADAGFNRDQVASLGTLLTDDSGSWRLAAMSLLRSPLMDEPEIRSHVERLLNDCEAEIRERARSIFRSFSSRVGGAHLVEDVSERKPRT